MRKLAIAAVLALLLVVGAVGYAAGQVAPPVDADDDRVTICVAGGDLNAGPHYRSMVWLAEDRGTCPTNYQRVDWLNS
jgi:hypothetical protein